MTKITEEQVLRAQQGDDAAGRALVEGLQRPVIATVYRFLGPAYRSDVEDIAQEIFVKIFRALRQFDANRATFTTWVYTLVRSHCFDVVKKRRPPTTGAGDEGHDDDRAAGHALQANLDAETSELGRRIGEALSTLSEDQRMVFVLREYERLDYREIAAATGVHEGTVKSRLARAKDSLRQQLAPYLERGA